MAFCNRCGATLADGTQFCSKCGAAITGTTAASGSTTTPQTTPGAAPAPAPTGGSSALKVVLIVVAVIVVVGALGLVALTVIGVHIARRTHVTQNGDQVKIETPFGTVSANDPDQAVKELGVEVYPGAQVQKNGTAIVAFGSMRTVNAMFESSDPVEKVCSFYQAQLPSASVRTSDQNHCSIVSTDPKNAITINVQANGDVTRIQVARVQKKSDSSD